MHKHNLIAISMLTVPLIYASSAEAYKVNLGPASYKEHLQTSFQGKDTFYQDYFVPTVPLTLSDRYYNPQTNQTFSYTQVSASAKRSPQPIVSASSSSTTYIAGYEVAGFAYAIESYYFSVDGPDRKDPVSVKVDRAGMTRSSSTGLATATLDITGQGVDLHEKAASNKVQDFFHFDPVDFYANTSYLITMSVDAKTYGLSSNEQARATLDPVFTLSDFDAASYTLNFSEGIGNSFSASPVPLPASAPMLGASLIGLGAVGYGLKRKTAAA